MNKLIDGLYLAALVLGGVVFIEFGLQILISSVVYFLIGIRALYQVSPIIIVILILIVAGGILIKLRRKNM